MKKYGVPVVVAINRFQCDTDAELNFIQKFCEDLGAEFALTEVFAKGGAGGKELAEKVCKTIETKPSNFHILYDTDLSVEEKVEKIAKEIYRADGVTFTAPAKRWHRSMLWAAAICRYAWQRHSTPCRMMLRSWASRNTSPSRSVT